MHITLKNKITVDVIACLGSNITLTLKDLSIIFSVSSGIESTELPPALTETVSDSTPSTPSLIKHTLTAENSLLVVYIAVPIILVAAIISTFVILYYKK